MTITTVNSSTTTVTSTQLVEASDIAFIKEMNINVLVQDIRPFARLKVFFDGVDVSHYCYQTNVDLPVYPLAPEAGPLGNVFVPPSPELPLMANASGTFKCVFVVPPLKFKTGNRELVVTDADNLDQLKIVNNTYGSASAIFSSKGTLQKFQTTRTNVTLTVVRNVDLWDPLAQSFFTTNESGGIFVTSIDVFFRTKDPSIPVRCEIRKLVNGYPAKLDSSNPDLISSLTPDKVNTSSNATAATKFEFNPPVYLPENGEYCFVLFSNSNKYEVWTSVLGERSIETGNIVFEQPYVGSLFKSENNVTWTAYQFEDIKFTINKAKFNTTAAGTATMRNKVPLLVLSNDALATETGSSEVTVTLTKRHGLIATNTVYAYSPTNINGVLFDGSLYPVTEIVDDYTFKVSGGSNATATGAPLSTGTIKTGQFIIVDGGSGYTSNQPLSFSGGGGTGLAATAIVENGSVVGINVTNVGSGYTSAPTVSIAGNAKIAIDILPYLAISSNAPTSTVLPQFKYGVFDNTLLSGMLSTGDAVPFNKETVFDVERNLVVSNNTGVTMAVEMSTQNANISPVIDLRKTPSLMSLHYNIDDTEPLSRYVTKQVKLQTPSVNVRLLATMFSSPVTNVKWYIRTSLSTGAQKHSDSAWVELTCDVARNKSTKKTDLYEYEFYLPDDIATFDTYDLKCEMYTTNKAVTPFVKNYRVIAVA